MPTLSLSINRTDGPSLGDDALSPRQRNAALGKALEASLRKHFRQRDAQPNKRNWKRQHFWGRIRNATSLAGYDDQKAVVTISDPAYSLKVHGGTVRPKEAKALTIPLREEAYGIRASSGIIRDLFFIRMRGSKKAYLAKREGTALRLYYLLVKQTRHKPDPEALPPTRTLQQAFAQAIDSLSKTPAT